MDQDTYHIFLHLNFYYCVYAGSCEYMSVAVTAQLCGVSFLFLG